MKTFTNIQEANRRIKRLRKELCCCPDNCPLSERTQYGDPMNILDIIQVQLFFNGYQIYGEGGITPDVAVTNANLALLGLATFSYDGTRIKMVTNLCGNFSLTAAIDNG